jgi:hypothetical protein
MILVSRIRRYPHEIIREPYNRPKPRRGVRKSIGKIGSRGKLDMQMKSRDFHRIDLKRSERGESRRWHEMDVFASFVY